MILFLQSVLINDNSSSWAIILWVALAFLVLFAVFVALNKTHKDMYTFKATESGIKKILRFFSPFIIVGVQILIIKYINNYYISMPASLVLIFSLAFLQLRFIDPPMLVVKDKGIHNLLRWKYNWEQIKSWQINKGASYLEISLADNTTKYFHNIKNNELEQLSHVLEEKWKQRLK